MSGVSAAKRRERREAGLCENDGRPLAPGRKRCQPCLDGARAYQNARNARLVEAGLCIRCAERPAEWARYCAICGPIQKAAVAAARAGYRVRKACTRCGAEPAAPGMAQGDRCLARGRLARPAHGVSGTGGRPYAAWSADVPAWLVEIMLADAPGPCDRVCRERHRGRVIAVQYVEPPPPVDPRQTAIPGAFE